ncbi:hypothetical protein E3Q24_02480 [Wallemia mellicola]|nr:hypothetical protein E3Q24_02480 [Wallemia mellicola]
MSNWQPQPEGLEQLLSLLRDSLSSNNQVQQAVTQRLETFNAIPDYNNYLCHVLIKATDQEERVRSVAGLILKNNIKFGWKQWPADSQEYVKSILVDGITDQAPMVRSTSGTAIVSVLSECGPENWPLALSRLMASIDSTNVQEQEGAFGTLAKICEDMYKNLDCEIAGVRPLDFMIPKFIQMLNHQSPKIRIHALSCLNSFIPTQSASFIANIDQFIAALFQIASDGVSEVRQFVCSALVRLLASRPDKLVPEMNNVATFMLYSTQDKDDDVALEACEFWLTFAEETHLAEHLKPLLDKVAPVLLNTMVYSENDLVMLEADDDDEAVPDKDTEIKPHIYGGKTHTQSSEAENSHQKFSREAEASSDEEDDEDDYDEFEDEELASGWNLRKCSAAAMDVLSINFGVDLLNILLPYLKERLFSQDWLQRESAILALGAISEGCIEGIQPHLPQLVPYLVNALNDPKPLVRSISCWSLGRYSSWSVQPLSVEHRNNYFVPTMEGLLRMVHDKNKRVQEAGCSAFATLEEEAGKELEPFLKPIIEHLVYAFQKYQRKNLLILYDAIGTLADAVNNSLDNEEYVTLLMQPLIDKWQNLADDDEDIIPLFECLSSLTVAAGSSFIKFAQPVYERCSRIVHGNLLAFQSAVERNDEDNIPDRTFIIVALDLISDRPETFKLCDIYFPDNADNVQRRTEVKYYARSAKKLTKALKKANKSEAEIRNEVYHNKELNKVKAIALDATTEPLRGYLYEYEKCRKFAYVKWIDSGNEMHLRPSPVVVHDLTPELEKLYQTPASVQLDDRGFAVLNSEPQSSLEPLDEESCIAEIRKDGKGHSDGADGKDAAPTDSVPAYRAHVDQDAKRAYEHIERENGGPIEKDKRVQIINVWRPCFDGIVDSPLSVCDYKTISNEDLGHTTDFFGSHYSILHNDKQKWCYIRDQQRHQVYFLRCFDSYDGKDGRARFVPHTAVEDKERACEKARQSVELRCIVVS